MRRRTTGDVARLDTLPRETLVALLPCDDNAPAMRTGREGEVLATSLHVHHTSRQRTFRAPVLAPGVTTGGSEICGSIAALIPTRGTSARMESLTPATNGTRRTLALAWGADRARPCTCPSDGTDQHGSGSARKRKRRSARMEPQAPPTKVRSDREVSPRRAHCGGACSR